MNEFNFALIMEEIRILKDLDHHPNIIKYEDAF